MEEEAPDRRATHSDIVRVKGFVEVESKSWQVAENKDGHNQDSDEEVGELSGGAAPVDEDLGEDSQVEETEE